MATSNKLKQQLIVAVDDDNNCKGNILKLCRYWCAEVLKNAQSSFLIQCVLCRFTRSIQTNWIWSKFHWSWFYIRWLDWFIHSTIEAECVEKLWNLLFMLRGKRVHSYSSTATKAQSCTEKWKIKTEKVARKIFHKKALFEKAFKENSADWSGKKSERRDDEQIKWLKSRRE